MRSKVVPKQSLIAIIGLVVVTFLGGIAAYQGFLQLLDYTVLPKSELRVLRDEATLLKGELAKGRSKKDILGIYEWQWSGENWYGRVTFDKQDDRNTISQARVGILKKMYYPDGKPEFRMEDCIIDLVRGSFAQIGENKCEIDLLVKKKVTNYHIPLEQHISGILEIRPCLAGKVTYYDHLTGQRYVGDMILVNYISLMGESVENWFATNIKLQ